MKFTLSWLKEHLDTEANVAAIGDALTSLGLEVEGIEDPAAKLGGFAIARVLTAAPHPQADKLQVLTVDAGANYNDGAPLQVVCGAPNARAGLVGVFGKPGAVVPANGMELRVAAIRGVESNGMMCSARELGIGEGHEGIIELVEDAPVGESFAAFMQLDDPLFDIAITPNRQDCMGVRGIARDLAAAGLGTLKPLAEVYRGATDPVAGEEPAPQVFTTDPDGCPAFYAQAVSGVGNGAVPEWITRKLKAIGQKPISLLVDITNFVSIDLGRPLHVYDRAKLTGPLVARKARDGEQVLALNGKTYTLDASMTVIADDAQVHDIAGIMGGEHSGVSETTTDVLIECAYFMPDAIARTGQKLALTSDARQRFERGVDPAFLDEGLAIATRLVLEHGGGKASVITRAGEPPMARVMFKYDPTATLRIAGIEVAGERQREILAALGFGVDGSWTVVVPSWRRDIGGVADIVEEIVRVEGLDKVPSCPLPRPDGVAKPTATPEQRTERTLRRAAAARGLDEAVTWSFIAPAQAALFGGGAWTLANPISEDMKTMRPSLLPGLLAAAKRNSDRGAEGVRLFELGRRYLAEGERATLGLVLAGAATPRGWRTGKAVAFDAYDAKAEALALLGAAGAPVDRLQVMEAVSEGVWHPGRSGSLRLGPKTVLAEFGELHPRLAKALDLDGPVVAAEIYIDAIPAARSAGRTRSAYTPPALQPVTRDFAFVAAQSLPADSLLRAVRGADKAAITDATLFDVFTGAGLAVDEKSLAVAVTFQPGEKSFTDAELQALSAKVVAAAEKAGARLRG
jgi:phenylalanyl-tRNA synthetase beta chain